MTKMTTDVPARTLPEPLLRVEDLERLRRTEHCGEAVLRFGRGRSLATEDQHRILR